jgi:hypothetical protein
MPGAATLARCRSEHCRPIGALLLRTGHPGNAGIRLDALLELVVDLNHGVADLIDLVALPGDRQECSVAHHGGDSAPSSPAAALIEIRKRAAGIEPASSAWKAEVLPLNYARIVDAQTRFLAQWL